MRCGALFVFLLILLVCSCSRAVEQTGATTPSPAVSESFTASVDTKSWVDVDCGTFSLRLPAGYRQVDVHGDDSNVGEFSCDAGKTTVTFDEERQGTIGDITRSLSMDLSDYKSWKETIDGCEVLVESWINAVGDARDGRHRCVCGTWVTWVDEKVRNGYRLTLVVRFPAESKLEEPVTIIRQLHYKKRQLINESRK
jgi:hypothetical protein